MRKNQKIVPIVTASDENYAPYLNVMMTTVLENCHAERPVHFYVIDDGLSLSSKKAPEKRLVVTHKMQLLNF